MTDGQKRELIVLQRRFPHIQEIFADSMDKMMLSSMLLCVAVFAVWHASQQPLGSPIFLGCLVVVAIGLKLGPRLYDSALEEDRAIHRLFYLTNLKREKS